MGTIRLLVTVAVGITLAGRPLAQAPAQRQPIIDMHLHAYRAADWKGSSPNPITGKPGPATAEEHMRQTLAALERYNVVKAIVSGPVEVVEQWRTAAPGRILASPLFGRPNVDLSGRPLPQIDELRSLFKSGRLSAIGEVGAQYRRPVAERSCARTVFRACRRARHPGRDSHRNQLSGYALSGTSALPSRPG